MDNSTLLSSAAYAAEYKRLEKHLEKLITARVSDGCLEGDIALTQAEMEMATENYKEAKRCEKRSIE